MLRDFRNALRRIQKYPIMCVVAIVSLAAGIGATTAMLTIRTAMFRNPPPLSPNPNELFEVFMPTVERAYRAEVPAGVFSLWADETRMVSGIAAARSAIARDVRTPDGPTMAIVRAVTPGVFSVLGVAPIIGRMSDLSTVVLSYRFWQHTFGGRPDTLGSVVRIDGTAYIVAGVMPERFWVFDTDTDIWTTLDMDRLPGDVLLAVIVRRRPDVTPGMLTQSFQSDVLRYISTQPAMDRKARVQIVQMEGTPMGHAIAPAAVWVLAACVVLTLIIACTNVAVLVIAQWTSREREIAIRAALGAGRWRIVRGLVAESLLLAVFGGMLGVCATFILLAAALRHAPETVHLFDFSIDSGVLMRIALITIFSGILAGLAPALYETRRLQVDPLRRIPSDRVRQRWRNALVVTEITVTIALLVVTSTMVDSYRRAVSADLGFDVRHLLAAAVEAPQGARIPEIRERLLALPGVIATAATTTPAMSRPAKRQRVALDGAGTNAMMADSAFVSPDFWTTLGIPIRVGRTFVAGEVGQSAAPVAVINAALAERMWPGRNPISMQLWTEGRRYDVIGVAADYRNMPLSPPAPAVYLPISPSEPITRITFYVRAAADPANLVQAVRDAIRGVAVDHIVSRVFTLQSVVEIIGEEILTAVYPMTPLIGMGLLLTAAGIYGVLAFAVTRRSRELAVRLAVGASTRQLATLIAILSFRLIGLGTVFGIGATFALSRFIRGQGGVFDSPSFAVFVVPMIIVFAVGALATFVPTRRALATSPAGLLRTE